MNHNDLIGLLHERTALMERQIEIDKALSDMQIADITALCERAEAAERERDELRDAVARWRNANSHLALSNNRRNAELEDLRGALGYASDEVKRMTALASRFQAERDTLRASLKYAAGKLNRLDIALFSIGTECSRYTNGVRCLEDTARHQFAVYEEDKWCAGCIAANALERGQRPLTE